jgi:hypothetical protein
MRFSRLLPAAIASLAVLCATVANSAPPTDVVFGNLGASGTNSLDSGSIAQVGSTIAAAPGNQFATAFVTGTDANFLTLTAINLGLGDVPVYSSAKVSLVADNEGSPTGTVLGTQTLGLGPNGMFSFNVGILPLSANTKYWVKVEDPTASDPSYFSWLRNLGDVSPSGQNSSGYSFPADGAMRSLTGGSSWSAYGSGSTLALSITAVPEPSTYALAGIGVVAAGLMRWRRRNAGR